MRLLACSLVCSVILLAQVPAPCARCESIVFLPDTQDDVSAELANPSGLQFTRMIDSILTANATYHFKLALPTGDLTNYGETDGYTLIAAQFARLEAVGIKVILFPGGHDHYDTYKSFAAAFLAGKSQLVAVYDGNYAQLVYQDTLLGRPLLIFAYSVDLPINMTNPEMIAANAWFNAQDTTFLASHPTTVEWVGTHFWWGGNCTPGWWTYMGNWVFSKPRMSFIYAGHWNQAPGFCYTETRPGGDTNYKLAQMQMDYQNCCEGNIHPQTYVPMVIYPDGSFVAQAYSVADGGWLAGQTATGHVAWLAADIAIHGTIWGIVQ